MNEPIDYEEDGLFHLVDPSCFVDDRKKDRFEAYFEKGSLTGNRFAKGLGRIVDFFTDPRTTNSRVIHLYNNLLNEADKPVSIGQKVTNCAIDNLPEEKVQPILEWWGSTLKTAVGVPLLAALAAYYSLKPGNSASEEEFIDVLSHNKPAVSAPVEPALKLLEPEVLEEKARSVKPAEPIQTKNLVETETIDHRLSPEYIKRSIMFMSIDTAYRTAPKGSSDAFIANFARQIYMIALTESGEWIEKGITKIPHRYEKGYQRSYINHWFMPNKKGQLRLIIKNKKRHNCINPYVAHFYKLYGIKPGTPVKDFKPTLEKHKRQLATSVGYCQVIFSRAYDEGWRGNFSDLEKPKINLEIAADCINTITRNGRKKIASRRIAGIYNTGSPSGIPHGNHEERAQHYFSESEKVFNAVKPVYDCYKGIGKLIDWTTHHLTRFTDTKEDVA